MNAAASTPVTVTFVCWGNICRSPMAERVFERLLEEAGADARHVRTDSLGISSEETGNPIDDRAESLLIEHGYRADGHAARQATAETIAGSTLLVAAEPFHLERLARLGAREEQLRLMTDYDPQSENGSALPDPWYGGRDGFETALGVLERGLPRLLDEVLARG